ncbi:MAG: hypothetical protein COB22_04465 [Cycloclasticus sp.]|nr:MAG: hypothetical protein COB22_04465 [Cycloclasticus sp.]
MTSKTENNASSIFEQFNSLIESNIPDEYKTLLQNFQEQGFFYNQLLQSIQGNDNLASFWDLPNTLGFSSTTHSKPNWFQSFFDINGFSTSANTTVAEQYTAAIHQFSQQAPDHIKTFQSALTKMSALHGELSNDALQRFERLRNEADTDSNEQLCQLWLKAGEQAFSYISQTDEYVQTQQSLFNALSELSRTQQALSEQFSTLLGLPSHRSITDLQKGLHELRIEFAAYREQTTADIHQLTSTIKKLQKK